MKWWFKAFTWEYRPFNVFLYDFFSILGKIQTPFIYVNRKLNVNDFQAFFLFLFGFEFI